MSLWIRADVPPNPATRPPSRRTRRTANGSRPPTCRCRVRCPAWRCGTRTPKVYLPIEDEGGESVCPYCGALRPESLSGVDVQGRRRPPALPEREAAGEPVRRCSSCPISAAVGWNAPRWRSPGRSWPPATARWSCRAAGGWWPSCRPRAASTSAWTSGAVAEQRAPRLRPAPPVRAPAPDIVRALAPAGLARPVRAGQPVRAAPAFRHHRPWPELAGALQRHHESRGERVIAVSNTVRDWLLQHYPVDPARVVVIPRGIDPVDFPYGHRPTRPGRRSSGLSSRNSPARRC